MIIPIGTKQFEIDDEDYDKIRLYPWTIGHNGYVEYKYDDNGTTVVVRLHRLLMGAEFSGDEVDHKDRNKLNYRKNNLRPCTKQQNSFNKPKQSGFTSPYKGVYWGKHISEWIANINFNYKTIYLISSPNILRCAYAYNIAATFLIKEFAYLNPIEYNDDKLKTFIENKLQRYVNNKR